VTAPRIELLDVDEAKAAPLDVPLEDGVAPWPPDGVTGGPR
jgi:hypothetical protein